MSGIWVDRVLAVATAVLWIAGVILFLSDADRAELTLIAAFVVGLAFCLRTWWRGRKDPDGPSLLDFINW
jgi:uncharacterized protein (DUF58 family)